MSTTRTLPALMFVYAAASLLHFTHNAEFLADYPNMPAWLSRAEVYGAWLAVTAVGILGYFLVRRGHELIGLPTIAIYAVLGFDGLGHYTRAPLAAHTTAMNATIWLEVLAATLLLAEVVRISFKRQPT